MIYLKSVALDLTGCLGFDVPLGGGGIYVAAVDTPSDREFEIQWTSGGSDKARFMPTLAGRSPTLAAAECSDAEVRYTQTAYTLADGATPTIERAVVAP